MKNYSTARILCFALGAFGGHKFYLGQLALGALYMSAWPLVFSGLPYYAVMPPLWIAVIVDQITLRSQVNTANAEIMRRGQGPVHWRDVDAGRIDVAAVDGMIARYAEARAVSRSLEPEAAGPSQPRRSFGRRNA